MTSTTSPDTRKPSSAQEANPFFTTPMLIAGAGIVVIVIAILFLTGGPAVTGTVSPQKCAESTVSYVNTNLVQPGTAATLVSVAESHGLYEIKVNYQAKDTLLYTSKDCSLLFMNPMNMQAPSATPAPTQAPKKSARPAVDLYVMSFCPYGTQAVTAMRPVYDLLSAKADIRIRYIATVRGTTIDTVSSLHGITEAKEDAFQLCVGKTHPALAWEYLRVFNEQCYPKWQDTTVLDACRKNVTAALKIDHAVAEACATGADAIALLKADEADGTSAGASASPTLIINGVEYRGARTPEAYKQAICNSFETAPSECSTVLSGSSAAAAGNC